jgi:hypothetical protein
MPSSASGTISVYDTSARTLNAKSTWSTGMSSVYSMHFFSKVSTQYLLAAGDSQALRLIYLSGSGASGYTVTVKASSTNSLTFRGIDISPSETHALVGTYTSNAIAYYSVSISSISLLYTYTIPSNMNEC